MSENNLQEAKQKKRVMEANIAKLLLEFSRETGLSIESISTRYEQTYDGSIAHYRVETEAQL